MDLLYAVPSHVYPSNLDGGAKSTHRLLVRLQARGWTVRVLCQSEDPGVYAGLGYPVESCGHFWMALSRTLEAKRPEVILTDRAASFYVLEQAREFDVRAIMYLRAPKRLQDAQRAAVAGFTVVCNSRYLQDELAREGVCAPMIPSIVDEDLGVDGPDPQGAIAMLNPVPEKGIDVFWQLAKAMPRQRFLLVEGWPLRPKARAEHVTLARKLPNVEWVDRTVDIGGIYARTKLLLYPSRWREPSGRAIVEAQSCGIPVVAAYVGGIPDTVQNGGILVAGYETEHWVEGIREALGRYEDLSEQARANAAAYRRGTEQAVDAFCDLASIEL